jgi:branched-chain amino acid transport system permease protein
MKGRGRHICTFLCLAMFYALLIFGAPLLDNYTQHILKLVAINAILAVSLNLVYGFGGMFSLGHAGFMAIGAYTSALLVLSPAQKEISWLIEPIIPLLATLQMPFWFSLLAAGLVAALFGLLIAIPVLRLGGDYLGIATLGFSEIIRVVIVNAMPVTNGPLGIKGIPPHATLIMNYTCLFITLYCLVSLLNSNFGNVIKAIRDDEIAAKVMGINTFRYKILAFTIGAFFAGIGGALLGNLITTIDPKMFTFLRTFDVLMIAVVGGLGSITGSILGSIVITFSLEWLRVVEAPFKIFGAEVPGIPGMRMVMFSLVLLCVILFRREGITGMREFSWNSLWNFLRRNFLRLAGKPAGHP